MTSHFFLFVCKIVIGKINKKYHDGVTTVTTSGTIMYFSRNNSKGKSKKNIIDLKVYSSILVNGAWKDATFLCTVGST